MASPLYQTKTELAVNTLRERITSGETSPGTHFTYAGLAKQLGMSQTPVREAVRILQSEGLIRQQPHKGPTVAELQNLSVAEAQDIYVVRVILEREATRLGAPHIDEPTLTELRQTLEDMRQADRGHAVRKLHTDWHFQIYRAAGSRYLEQMVTWAWNRFPWEAVWLVPGRWETAMEQHDAIADALASGDADEAANLMEEHIMTGRDAVLEHLRRQHD